MLRPALSRAAQGLGQLAARGYVAGAHLDAAIEAGARLDREGLASTICFWNGEADTPEMVALEYRTTLRRIAEAGLSCYPSVKAPAFAYRRDVAEELREGCRALGVRLHFDSLSPETVEPTQALLRDLGPDGAYLGTTLPGRWSRSVADSDLAVTQGVAVRVVKGQWSDPTAPDLSPGTGFLRVVDALAGRARHVAVASHDAPLSREALRRLRQAGTPCELELLYGLPMRQVLAATREFGVQVRVYVPFGTAWLPYALGHVRRNPHVIGWLLKDLLTAGASRVGQGLSRVRPSAKA